MVQCEPRSTETPDRPAMAYVPWYTSADHTEENRKEIADTASSVGHECFAVTTGEDTTLYAASETQLQEAWSYRQRGELWLIPLLLPPGQPRTLKLAETRNWQIG